MIGLFVLGHNSPPPDKIVPAKCMYVKAEMQRQATSEMNQVSSILEMQIILLPIPDNPATVYCSNKNVIIEFIVSKHFEETANSLYSCNLQTFTKRLSGKLTDNYTPPIRDRLTQRFDSERFT